MHRREKGRNSFLPGGRTARPTKNRRQTLPIEQIQPANQSKKPPKRAIYYWYAKASPEFVFSLHPNVDAMRAIPARRQFLETEILETAVIKGSGTGAVGWRPLAGRHERGHFAGWEHRGYRRSRRPCASLDH
jgi:hypothetical protein